MVFKSLVYVLASIQLAVCVLPNTFEIPSNGVLPSPVTYFEGIQNENKTNAGRSHEARFGYIPSSFGGASSGMGGYQGNSVSSYGSQKIDIGGLVVGAVVGLGILIFIPKILYLLFATTNIFSAQPVGNGYSGYGRSEDIMSGLNDIVTKIEESMSKYNINTTECMQKALCTYIHSTEQVKEKSGINNFVDNSINTLTKNSVMNFMIDGSRFKAALEAGKNGECNTVYRQCPFDQNSIYMFLRQISTKK
ncbi:uncharacterized protein LOC132920820 [Rhopalosiphum padi]|uniref:uncharacterized protein LOC132920820 n=1 Tax=Rhopalosiphum padi TaxID=40932 RepID=UPI00298DB394|nr:uncharacterized protein LOC132920820 [Rhopalosiphum padi]